MNLKNLSICFLMFIFFDTGLQAQSKKIDTTVKMGDQGYRVECSNKEADENYVSISPVGLRIAGSKPSFKVLGRVNKALTDDFNDDGLPDLVICVYNESNNQTTIVSMSYTADKNLVPIYFPDIYLDPKLREGYKGYDEFSVLTGTLLRKFPIYLPDDTSDKPTGGIRTIQYKAMNDGSHLSFKALRSFDVKN